MKYKVFLMTILRRELNNMNLLLDNLDKIVKKRIKEDFNTNFRNSILFELIMQESSLSNEAKIYQALKIYYPNMNQITDVNKAINNILWFYKCGKEEQEEKTSQKASKERYKRIYSYEFDNELIYSAFKDQYNIDLQDIEYLSGTLIADDTCLGITYLTNASASRVLFEVSGVIDDVEITLYFTNIEQTLSPPSTSGGANGIVVSATAGGVASIVGDDFENLGDNDTITFIARLAQNGYRFSHWEDDEGNNLGTTDNLVLTKAEAYNKKIIAVFVPLDQSNANFDTNNDDTQEFY